MTMYDSSNVALTVTYNSGTDDNYISEKDQERARLPALRRSTKWVGVANGGESTGKYRTRLPIKKLSPVAAEADSFQDFPTSLLSVGKVAEDGNVSVFDKNGVAVYTERDVLITVKGEPIMIGKRDDRGRYHIPLMQQRGQWQPRRPSKRATRTLHSPTCTAMRSDRCVGRCV